MKYFILLTTILLSYSAFGQNLIETRTATLNDGDYSLDGTVYLELYDDNSLNLRFDSDYLTQSNVFDVHVFLTNDNNYASPIDTSGMLLIENIGTIDGLNYSSGPMTFNLPSGVGINDYEHIVFVCVQFGRLHWGDGTFGNSVMSSIHEIGSNKEQVNIYPNPSKDGVINIGFQQVQQDATIEVFNINGQMVWNEYSASIAQQYSVELEETGTYIVKITTAVGTTVQKVVRL